MNVFVVLKHKGKDNHHLFLSLGPVPMEASTPAYQAGALCRDLPTFCLGKRAGISPYEHKMKAGSPPYEQALRGILIQLSLLHSRMLQFLSDLLACISKQTLHFEGHYSTNRLCPNFVTM